MKLDPIYIHQKSLEHQRAESVARQMPKVFGKFTVVNAGKKKEVASPFEVGKFVAVTPGDTVVYYDGKEVWRTDVPDISDEELFNCDF